MKLFRIALLVVVVGVPVAVLTWTPRSHAQDSDGSRGLVGTWNVTVRPGEVFICGNPNSIASAPTFTELATYADGGTLIETNTLLNFNSFGLIKSLPFNASDGHGAWEREGEQFKASFRKLVFDPTGVYVANADVHETIAIDGPDPHKFSGSFTIQFGFLNGPNICSGGTLSAERMHAD
jgi:hypothetical protein